MKKYLSILLVACGSLLTTSCLDLEPVSQITDSNYWQSADQFRAFNVGLHGQLREKSFNMFMMGEMRTKTYSGSSFTGEASRGYEVLYENNLSQTQPVISNFAGYYSLINQLNLMISKTENTTELAEADKNFYLGEAYGMRAFVYFQLLRSWGGVIIQLDYTQGTSIDLGNLSKPASSAEEVMAQIKKDIDASNAAFGDDYSFKLGRTFWSKSATQMLKGEVYLWSGKRMNGGTSDYETAKTALTELKDKSNASLLNDFTQVFSFDNKDNAEILFAIRNEKDEYTFWNDSYRLTLVMNQQFFPNYYTEEGVRLDSSEIKYNNGVKSLEINSKLHAQLYRAGDTRQVGSLMNIYSKNANGDLVFAGNVARKFRGTMVQGGSTTSWLDDYPVYRYSDCLLSLAEAKVLLGEDPSEEINAVRKRAYGETYFNAHKSEVAYPNDTDATFYASNEFVGSDANPVEAVLKERMREFLFEAKRWYDLRLMGDEYVAKYTTLTDMNKQLWPIDENTLGENSALKQTPGY